jgi:hypothetical protein
VKEQWGRLTDDDLDEIAAACAAILTTGTIGKFGDSEWRSCDFPFGSSFGGKSAA